MHRVAPRYLKLVTFSNFWQSMLISVLILFVMFVMILPCSVLTSRRCSVYESVGEILKFTIAAVHKIEVVGKSLVAYRPSIDGDGCVVMECLLHDLL